MNSVKQYAFTWDCVTNRVILIIEKRKLVDFVT